MSVLFLVVDTEFEDLEKYVKELNMSDDGGDVDVGDLEADMALLDKLAEDDGDDGGVTRNFSNTNKIKKKKVKIEFKKKRHLMRHVVHGKNASRF